MTKYFVTAFFIISSSVQHYIPPPDQCVLAKVCNHTWVAQCGEDIKDLEKRWFLDKCDMFEYNCEHKKIFTFIKDFECHNISQNTTEFNVTLTLSTNLSVSSTITTESSFTLPNYSNNTTFLTTSRATVCYTVNDTTSNLNTTTVSSSTTSLNSILSTMSPKNTEAVANTMSSTTYPIKETLGNNTAGKCTCKTETTLITSIVSDGVTDTPLISEFTTQFSILSPIESTTELSALESNSISSIEFIAKNLSGSFTSMNETKQSVTISMAEPEAEVSTATEPSRITNITNIHNCTRNMDTTASLLMGTILTTTTKKSMVINTITENNTTSIPEANSYINKTDNHISKHIVIEAETTKLDNNKENVTDEIILNSTNITTERSIKSTVENDTRTTTSSNLIATNELPQTLVTCKSYPKECKIPVTWETTEKGETRDFYQILKARYGSRIHLYRDTTQLPRRAFRYFDNKI